MSAERVATVLTVDDNARSRRATLRLLRQAGFRTRQAATSEQALCIIAKERPDLVILSDDLEGVRGSAVAAQIKRLPEGRQTPVLRFTSPGAPPGALPEGIEIGVDGCLSRPADPAALLTMINALLRARRIEQSAAAERAAWEARVETAEQRVREAEESKRILDAIMEHLPLAIVVVDAPAASVRMVSRYGLQTAGRAAESMIGLSAEELAAVLPIYQPDGVTPVPAEEMHIVRAARCGEAAATQQWAVIGPGGEKMTVLSTAGPICDREGDVIGGVVVWQDITPLTQLREERERLIEDLERQRRFLETVLDSTPAAIAYVDRESHFALVNPAYLAASGRQREDLIGRSILDYFPQPAYRALYFRARETGEQLSGREAPLTLPARPEVGLTYWDFTLTPLKSDAGEVEGVLLTAIEVTDTVLSRERIAASERDRAREARMLTTILESVPGMVAYLDRELRYLHVNSQMARAFGRTPQELVGVKHHDGLYRLSPQAMDNMQGMISTGTPMVNRAAKPIFPVTWRKPTEYDAFDVSVIPVKDEAGNVEGMVVFVNDVTEAIAQQEKLLETERARAELAETLNREINHRVKNNLMMVVGLLQMQIAGETDPRLADALHDAMGRLLVFASVHEQLRFAPSEEIDVFAGLRRIADVNRTVFTKAQVDLTVEGEPVFCPAPPATPVLIIANELLTNALKHGAPEADGRLHVEVKLAVQGDLLQLSVWSSGNPLPEDFDPGAQTTLGLRLVWDVVVTRYQGAFTLRPERGGNRAELTIDYQKLRQDL